MKKMGYTNIRRTLNGTGKICIYLFTKALPARTRLFLRLVQVLISFLKYSCFQPQVFV